MPRRNKSVCLDGDGVEGETVPITLEEVEGEDNQMEGMNMNRTGNLEDHMAALNLLSLNHDLEYRVRLNKLEEKMSTKALEAISLGVKGDCPQVAANCNQVIQEYLMITQDMDVDAIGAVVDHAEFVFLLKRWLTSKFNALKLEALSLLSLLAASDKTPMHLEKLKGLGLVTDLVGLLASSNDDTVCQYALLTIESLFRHDLLVREVVASSKFLSSLTKLANRDYNEPWTLSKCIIELLCTLSKKRDHLSMGSVKNMMSTLRIMMDIKDTWILDRAVSCLATLSSSVDGAFEVFLRGGLVLRVVALLSNDAAKEVHTQVRLCVAAFANTEDTALTLFKLLKGTTHLKQYWKLWLHDAQIPSQHAVAEEALSLINDLVRSPSGTVVINALIKCGMMHSLVQCLKSDTPLEFQRAAVMCIGKMTCDIGPTEKRALLDAGILPFLVALLQTQDVVTLSMCVCTMGNIVQSNTLVRDKLLSYGVVDSLLKLLETHKTTPTLFKPLIAALQMIISVNPKSSLAFYRNLPGVFNELVDLHHTQLDRDPEFAIAILLVFDDFISHGGVAVEELMKTDILTKLFSLMTAKSSEMVRQAACSVLLLVLEVATVFQKQAILNDGIILLLCSLLQPASSGLCRQVALRALLSFREEELECPPEQQQLIQITLVPILLQQLEMQMNDPVTRCELLQVLEFYLHRSLPEEPQQEIATPPPEMEEETLPSEVPEEGEE